MSFLDKFINKVVYLLECMGYVLSTFGGGGSGKEELTAKDSLVGVIGCIICIAIFIGIILLINYVRKRKKANKIFSTVNGKHNQVKNQHSEDNSQ